MMLLIGPCNLKIVKNEKKKGDLIFFSLFVFCFEWFVRVEGAKFNTIC